MPAAPFDYNTAFSRNIGLVSENEQVRLRRSRIGLAGLGGVGGAHLQALARMGIGAFHLADPDVFDTVNINRQLGATVATLGRPKAQVLAETAQAINPTAEVRIFPRGIDATTIDAFLAGVDAVVDGIEFFAVDARRLLFAACRERGIPIVTAGPIGYGAAVLVFAPDGESFESHFRLDSSMTRAERLMAFALGLAPGLAGDVDPSRVDIDGEKGPALVTACLLCAAAAATEVLKLLCGRGTLAQSPRGIYFDPYRCRTVPLRPRPHLHRSLRGRILRWLFFRRFPALRQMHDRELAARAASIDRLEAPSHANA